MWIASLHWLLHAVRWFEQSYAQCFVQSVVPSQCISVHWNITRGQFIGSIGEINQANLGHHATVTNYWSSVVSLRLDPFTELAIGFEGNTLDSSCMFKTREGPMSSILPWFFWTVCRYASQRSLQPWRQNDTDGKRWMADLFHWSNNVLIPFSIWCRGYRRERIEPGIHNTCKFPSIFLGPMTISGGVLDFCRESGPAESSPHSESYRFKRSLISIQTKLLQVKTIISKR